MQLRISAGSPAAAIGVEAQFRDGKMPCKAMHCSKTAPVAVKIGLAVGSAKVVTASPP
jgi:hypothetical protein